MGADENEERVEQMKSDRIIQVRKSQKGFNYRGSPAILIAGWEF